MARAIKQGQHIFIAFQDGEAVLESQLRPRMYKSREQFEKSFPAWRDGKAELVEYAPTLSQPSNEPLTLEQLREMDRGPVYSEKYKRWFLVTYFAVLNRSQLMDSTGTPFVADDCGPLYLCPPEGEADA